LILLFEFIATHERFFKLMFSDKGIPGFKSRIERTVREQLYDALLQMYVNERRAKVSPEVVISCVLSAHMGVITDWLDQEKPLPPK
jgi:hypothetical protein